MKKIQIICIGLIFSIGLVSCINCGSKPTRQAYMHAQGSKGMQYHFSLYDVVGDAQHNTLKCTKYKYVKTDIYADNLGEMKMDEVIWVDALGRTIYPVAEASRMKIYLSKTKIITIGFDYNGAERGEYDVKKSAPK